MSILAAVACTLMVACILFLFYCWGEWSGEWSGVMIERREWFQGNRRLDPRTGKCQELVRVGKGTEGVLGEGLDWVDLEVR